MESAFFSTSPNVRQPVETSTASKATSPGRSPEEAMGAAVSFAGPQTPSYITH